MNIYDRDQEFGEYHTKLVIFSEVWSELVILYPIHTEAKTSLKSV